MTMSEMNIYCLPGAAAVDFAGHFLEEAGVFLSREPGPGVTHWLLPVPTRGLPEIPPGVTVIGGNLPCPGIDLLKDPWYLAQNSAITARCAIALMKKDPAGLPVLILGWGRIGKCLGKFLAEAGADVTIAARKEADAAMIQALGYKGILIRDASADGFGAVLNTVPAMVLDATGCPPGCLLMELASVPGIAGENIVDARGLPGRYAPEESGRLIARTVLRLCGEEQA